MAEALLGVVFENLLSLVQNEFATISGITSKAEKLSTTLDLIKAVLEDAEQKQVTDRSIKDMTLLSLQYGFAAHVSLSSVFQ